MVRDIFNILITWASWMHYESKWQIVNQMATISMRTDLKSSWPLINWITQPINWKICSCLPKWLFKLSILGCLFLQHPLPWTELELPAGLRSSTQGMDNPAVAGDKCSGLHLHFRLAFWKSGHKPLILQIAVQASGDGLQVETSQYWKFKAVSSEGSCRFSNWCVA